jgi:hypothetical protein
VLERLLRKNHADGIADLAELQLSNHQPGVSTNVITDEWLGKRGPAPGASGHVINRGALGVKSPMDRL